MSNYPFERVAELRKLIRAKKGVAARREAAAMLANRDRREALAAIREAEHELDSLGAYRKGKAGK